MPDILLHKRREAHMRFIRQNIDLLLAAGWAGYQEHGRGAILVDADRAVPDPQWEGGITPGQYVTPRMLQDAGLDWPDADLKRMVREYAPEREIVVAILEGSDADYYRFGGRDRSPRQCWDAVGAQLGEMVLRPGELERWARKH